MFQQLLRDVVEQTEGGVASLVMDLDGIALDRCAKESAAFDINSVGVELSVVLKSAIQAASMLDAGGTQEVTVVADKLVTLVRLVNDNYFVALSLLPEGNVGKARYMLRTRVPEMVAELS